jgi:hypothetical protein
MPDEAVVSEDGAELEEEVSPPVGTLFILMLYIMVLAGMWGAMYWILLSR